MEYWGTTAARVSTAPKSCYAIHTAEVHNQPHIHPVNPPFIKNNPAQFSYSCAHAMFLLEHDSPRRRTILRPSPLPLLPIHDSPARHRHRFPSWRTILTTNHHSHTKPPRRTGKSCSRRRILTTNHQTDHQPTSSNPKPPSRRTILATNHHSHAKPPHRTEKSCSRRTILTMNSKKGPPLAFISPKPPSWQRILTTNHHSRTKPPRRTGKPYSWRTILTTNGQNNRLPLGPREKLPSW